MDTANLGPPQRRRYKESFQVYGQGRSLFSRRLLLFGHAENRPDDNADRSPQSNTQANPHYQVAQSRSQGRAPSNTDTRAHGQPHGDGTVARCGLLFLLF